MDRWINSIPITIGDRQSHCPGALHVVVAAIRFSTKVTRAFAVLREAGRVVDQGMSRRGMGTASI